MSRDAKNFAQLTTGLLVFCIAFTGELAVANENLIRESIDGDSVSLDLVVVDAGSFVMGSPETEAGRSKREGPQVTMSFARPFAIGRTEITVGQFAAFVAATGYVTDVEKRGTGKIFNARDGRMVAKDGVSWRHDFRGFDADPESPAIRVSWQDAQAFVAWLSEKSGKTYRLPSESEFEYALRAGTSSRYWWGNGSPDRLVENIMGDRERLKELRWPVGFRGYTDRHWGPAHAGSFEANPFGLFDMGGNVAEWVEDCYSGSLSALPGNGQPLNSVDCDARVFRGGAWGYAPPLSRSAYRHASNPDHASIMLGFRIATDVTERPGSQARR